MSTGPYAIEFTRDREGLLAGVRLKERKSEAELAAARPETPLVIGKMYLPVRLELKKLGSGMRTVSLHAGQEKLIHYLDLMPQAISETTVQISADKGTTLYFDDFIMRPLPPE